MSAYEHEIQKLRQELQQRYNNEHPTSLNIMMYEFRDTNVDKEHIERLAQECQEAQREKVFNLQLQLNIILMCYC